jgi:hypothetical protein
MQPTISYYLAQARIADLSRRAQRDALARATRRARAAQRAHPAPGWPNLGHRMLALLQGRGDGAGTAVTSRARPGFARLTRKGTA